MKVTLEIVSEEARESGGKEYCSAVGREVGEAPLLQFLEYSLSPEERLQHKGKLVGKKVDVQMGTIRGVFAGRPQFNGKIIAVK